MAGPVAGQHHPRRPGQQTESLIGRSQMAAVYFTPRLSGVHGEMQWRNQM